MLMLRLIIQSGSLVGREFQFEPGDLSSLLIGRGPESAVRLAEPSVSSRHAMIAADGDAFYLLDQNSANGTFLNETRVSEAKLRHGDVIGLGRQGPRLQVLIEGQDTMRIDAADTTTMRQDTATLRQETSVLDQDTSTLRHDSSTRQYYAPPTTRMWLRDDARNIGLYNPHFDTGKSKKSPAAALMWLVFAVIGVVITGLTIYDVGAPAALAGAISSIIPAGFYLTIFLWLGRYDPEPPGTLIFSFVLGAFIALFFFALPHS